MISNTATPKWYGLFRENVLSGKQPVCKEIAMEMCRIDALIANPGIYYDDSAIDGFVAFCEKELTLTDGADLHLLPTFKLWSEQLLSWFYEVEQSVFKPNEDGSGGRFIKKRILKRLVNKQYLIVGRGAAKSLYATCIHSYFLCVDTTTTDQIVVAPTMYQAEETMGPLSTAISRSRGPLFSFMTRGSIQNTTGSLANRPKLCSTKKGIQNFLTNSILEVKPMSIAKLQGIRTKVASVDEWLSCDIREDVIGALEQGAAKGGIDDYIILATSSEGTVRNGAGDSVKMELTHILRGDYAASNVSIFWYKLDDIKEVSNPNMWIKAQPNLGVTVTYEAYQRDVVKAEQEPSSRNDTLAKRFGIPTEGFTYYFTYEETLVCDRRLDFWQLPCSMGADMSQGDDFCAFVFLFPLKGGSFGLKAMCYITELTFSKLNTAARNLYEEFMEEGSLVVLNGSILDMMEVYDDVDEHVMKREYDVRSFGYDPYNAKAFVSRWITENGEYGVEKVKQGARTESVPLGEIKHLASERMLLFDQKIIQYTMGNAIAIEDTNGNRKLYKKRYDAKIDCVAAAIDAMVAYKSNIESFE